MSYSSFLVQIPGGVPLKSIKGRGRDGRRTTRKVIVCCCPWSGPESKTNKNSSIEFQSNNIAPLKKIKVPDHQEQQRRFPPGPSLLHLIGLLHYPMRSLPYIYALRDLANTYGPLLHLQVGEVSVILISSPRIAKEVLKTHDVACANRPDTMTTRFISYEHSDIVTSPYGEYWKQMRHICIAELLSAKNVRSFEYIRKDQGRMLVDDIMSASRGGPLDLTEKIIWFMNSMTCRVVFGNVSMDRAKTVKLIRAAMAAAGNVDASDLFPSIKLLKHISWNAVYLSRMKSKMDKILDGIIDDHRKNLAVTGKGYGKLGTEDFVDVMIRLKESDQLQFPITDDIIKAVICDMFAGGIESVSSAVDWSMAELMKNPRVMAKAQAEIRQAFGGRKTKTKMMTMEEWEIRKLSYLKLVVKETMRLHPPNAVLPRSCREDNIEIDGYHIPQNSIIIVNLWWLGRDPRNWKEPERFQPERFEGSPVDFLGNHFEYIPFGAGKRICPGIAFAMASVEFVLAHLLYYYDWELPPGTGPEDLDMTEVDGFAASRKGSLNLIATPYAPAFTN